MRFEHFESNWTICVILYLSTHCKYNTMRIIAMYLLSDFMFTLMTHQLVYHISVLIKYKLLKTPNELHIVWPTNHRLAPNSSPYVFMIWNVLFHNPFRRAQSDLRILSEQSAFLWCILQTCILPLSVNLWSTHSGFLKVLPVALKLSNDLRFISIRIPIKNTFCSKNCP